MRRQIRVCTRAAEKKCSSLCWYHLNAPVFYVLRDQLLNSFIRINTMLTCYNPSLQVNESVLRPTSMEPLSDLQLAEELIKQEMITMLHYDCLHHPSASAASALQRGKGRGPTSTSNNASHIAYLESHSYKPVSTEEMEQVTHTSTTWLFSLYLHT